MPVKLGSAVAGATLDGASLDGASLGVAADGLVVAPPHAATTIAMLATTAASRGDQLLGARDMRIFLHCARGPCAASPAVHGLLHARPHAVAGDCAGSLAHGGRVSSGSCSGSESPSPSSRPRSGTWRRIPPGITSSWTRHGPKAPDSSSSLQLGSTGYLLQDLAAEVAMRLDDPRLAALVEATPRFVSRRVVRRGVGRPSVVHRGRPRRGRGDPPRPPKAVPADLRLVRRAPVLRPRRSVAGRPVAPSA